MKAMVATTFGSPDVLEMRDVPDPVVGPMDLLVQVHATAVNPVDCKIRADGGGIRRKPPLILGFDVSGIVEAVGDRVEQFRPGDAVYASPNLARDGANAEFVAVDARTAAYKADELDHASAAALPLVTITAWEALHQRARLHHEETVLIHAGGGGVGHIAIQLAKLHGCRVLTTASRDESIALCKKLGADVVINYKQEDVVERVRDATEGQGCPVVFDTVGGDVFTQSLDCVAVHGRLVTILPPPPDAPLHKLFIKNVTLALEFMGAAGIFGVRPEAQGEILLTATELAEVGKLTPHLHATYPLADLPAAHRQQETGHTTGKLAVMVLE